MSLAIQEQLAHPENYGGMRSARQIQYLVIHYTGNDGDSAAGNAAYFQRAVVKTSAHYFVDGDAIYRSVPDLWTAWAVGGKKYANADKTGGGRLYGAVTNTNSLSVELCDTVRDGTYQATEATLRNAAALCRELMAKYHIPLERVVRHFDVTGKHCPSYFVNAQKWTAFKTRLTSGENDREETLVTYQYLTQVPETFRPTIEKLMNAGIIQGDGSDPDGNRDVINLTHEQVRTLEFVYRGGGFDRKFKAMGLEPAVE